MNIETEPSRIISSGDAVCVIAEIGVNHEGNEELAADLIRSAADCGADVVKFQTFRAENYVSTVQPERRERVARFQLSHDAFRRLASVAQSCGVEFLSTPLHGSDIEFLDELCSAFKISSGDVTYHDLLAAAAARNKLIILSTGLASEREIQNAIDTMESVWPEIRQEGKLVLMHCVAAYPTPPEEANLANIEWLRETFGCTVGYSDHTLGIKACELAVTAGASVIEKHFTYRKEDQEFHDHALSADPIDLKQAVEAIREATRYRGRKERIRTPSEEKFIQHLRRSVAAGRDIPAGELVEREWLAFLRPAWGVPADEVDTVVGRRLTRRVPAGDLIMPDDIEQ